MWWHKTVRRAFVVLVYCAGLTCMILPLIGTVHFLERIGPSQTSGDAQQIFWVAWTALAGALPNASPKEQYRFAQC